MSKILKVESEAERKRVQADIIEMRKKLSVKLAKYKHPRNAQEWWDTLKEWWPEIVAIWKQFIFFNLSKEAFSSLDQVLITMRKNRHPELELYCHRAWVLAPDHGGIHSFPGWSVLCDLCSEAHLLYDKKKGDGTLIHVPEEVD